jgi:hypothetical protein
VQVLAAFPINPFPSQIAWQDLPLFPELAWEGVGATNIRADINPPATSPIMNMIFYLPGLMPG